MQRLLLALCLVTVAVLATTRIAYADDPAERAARRHYDRGKKLFDVQKFDEAIDEFQKAYDAKPIPKFLFNIGQCQRNLGDNQAAIFSFKKYLKLDPDADDREQVEELIDDLQKKIDEGETKRLKLDKKNKDKDEQPRPVETGDRPVYKKWWFWAGVSVVAVGAGVGIYVATRPSTPDTAFGNIAFRTFRFGR